MDRRKKRLSAYLRWILDERNGTHEQRLARAEDPSELEPGGRLGPPEAARLSHFGEWVLGAYARMAGPLARSMQWAADWGQGLVLGEAELEPIHRQRLLTYCGWIQSELERIRGDLHREISSERTKDAAAERKGQRRIVNRGMQWMTPEEAEAKAKNGPA